MIFKKWFRVEPSTDQFLKDNVSMGKLFTNYVKKWPHTFLPQFIDSGELLTVNQFRGVYNSNLFLFFSVQIILQFIIYNKKKYTEILNFIEPWLLLWWPVTAIKNSTIFVLFLICSFFFFFFFNSWHLSVFYSFLFTFNLSFHFLITLCCFILNKKTNKLKTK